MKTHRLISPKQLIALVGLLLALPLGAQTWTKYEAQPGSKVKLDGSSNIHDWTVEGLAIGGTMELDSSFPLDASLKSVAALKVVPKVHVTIPVRSLKSGKKRMDEVMHEAMKQPEFPKIEYQLKEMTPKSAEHTPGTPFQFDTKGELTISGVTRTNAMVVDIDVTEKGKLKVTGTTTVKMTDFGIKPPSPALALGLIKTADDVKITFEWLTAEAASANK